MAASTLLYAATADGLFTVATENLSDWRIQTHALKGWAIPRIAVDPSRPNVVFAATRGDGVWASDDFGQSWKKPCYGKPGPGKVMCVTLDPRDPKTLYAGTEPIDVFVSHNAGRDWTRLDSVRRLPWVKSVTYPVPTVEPHVREIALDPKDSKKIYVALQVGYILKSEDGGESWKLLNNGLDADVHTIAINPENTDNLLIATGGHDCRLGQAKGRALYRSGDGGESWIPMATEFSQEYSVPLVIHPKDPRILYSVLANGEPPKWRRPTGAESLMIRTKDGGSTWERLDGRLSEWQRSFADSLVIDEAEPNHIYAALRTGELLASFDGGECWEKLATKVGPAGDIFAFSDLKCVHP